VLQGAPFQQLHGDEVLCTLLVDLMDRANVGMIQGRSGAGFPLKALNRLPVAGVLFRKEFQGHAAPEPHILSPVDYAHPATAQLLQNAVMRNGLTKHRRHAMAYGFRKSTLECTVGSLLRGSTRPPEVKGMLDCRD
jgi:hypothetical protein